METESAGEKTVTEGDLSDVFIGNAAGRDDPGHAFAPYFHIIAGIGADDRFPRCTRGSVDLHDIFDGRSEKLKGIIVPQIRFGHQRQKGNIGEFLDMARFYAGFIHDFLVVRNVVITTVHCPF